MSDDRATNNTVNAVVGPAVLPDGNGCFGLVPKVARASHKGGM
jgi:hypothetical protein